MPDSRQGGITAGRLKPGRWLGAVPSGVVADGREQAGRKPARQFGKAVGFPDAPSTQYGLLEAQLKGAQGASSLGEHPLEMLNGLKERVGLQALRNWLLTAKQATQIRQPATQPLKQVVESLQAER